jgi:ubiquinone biosynthesis protein UbiJ
MGTADKKRFGLEFDASVVPAVIAALVGLLGKVVSTLPEGSRPNPQVLQTTGMTLAMNEQGEMGLVLALEGGAELTLAMPTSDLPKLRDQIEEAISASGLRPKH